MTDVLAQLQDSLPADLGQQGHNVAVIQEAIDKLDAFQAKARTWLFSSLAEQARQTTPELLGEALSPLCDSMYLLPDSTEAQLAPHIQHYRGLTAQIAALEQQLAQEAEAAGVQAQVTEFEAFLQNGQYGDAAWAVVRMHKTLQAEQEQAQPQLGQQALQTLQASCEGCEARMAQVLDEAAAHAMSIDTAARVLYVRSVLPCGNAPVSELWAALQARGELQQRMNGMADELLRLVIEPVLASGRVLSVQGPPAGSHEPAQLVWGDATPGQEHTPENCCQKVLKLVGEHLFGWDVDLLRKWGDVFWRRLSDAYVRLHAMPFVKANADDSAACSAKADAARGLEEFAESLGVIEEPYLAPAVDALSQQVICARQQRYLEQARTLILAGATAEPVQVGMPLTVDQQYCSRLLSGELQEWELQDPPCGCSAESSVLACGQYQISAHMPAVLGLVERALQDAASSGEPTTAEALVGAVSKIALMARILPDREQLQQVPQLALLHFNDLRHLADALLLLPACFGPELQPLLQEQQEQQGGGSEPAARLSFLEDALLLRQAAEDIMTQQVALQQQAFGELLEGLGHLKKLGTGSSAQAGITYRKTIRQVLHSLGRLGRSAAAVLAPEPLVRLASEVLSIVCSGPVSDVVAKRDIGIDDAKELRDVLHPLAEEALAAFLGTATSAAGSNPQQDAGVSGVPMAVISAAVLARCAPLRKLQSLLALLDTGMKDLVAAWLDGRLQRDGWDRPELERLLTALFQDSEYRRQALAKVRAT